MAANQELTAAVATIKAVARQFAPLLKLADAADALLAAANQYDETIAATVKADGRLDGLRMEIAAAQAKLDALNAERQRAIDQLQTEYNQRRAAATDTAEAAERSAAARIAAAAERAKSAEAAADKRISDIKAANAATIARLTDDHNKTVTRMTAERDVLKNELDALKAEVADVKSRFSSLLT